VVDDARVVDLRVDDLHGRRAYAQLSEIAELASALGVENRLAQDDRRFSFPARGGRAARLEGAREGVGPIFLFGGCHESFLRREAFLREWTISISRRQGSSSG